MSTLFRTLRSRSVWTLVCASAVATLAGCYSYPTYSPYGYGQPYGTGGYPTYAPGGQIQPTPDPSMMGQPSLGAPTNTPGAFNGNNFVSPTAPASGSNYAPAGGGLVPNYTEPQTRNITPFSSETLSNARVTPTADAEADPEFGGKIMPTDFNEPAAEPAEPEAAEPEETPTLGAEPEAASDAEDTEFRPPIQRDQSATESSDEKLDVSAVKPTDCDYDKENLAWMQGVVDFDKSSKTWNIIYNMDPKSDDKLGGSVTLSDVDRFPGIHDGDLIYVKGKIDAETTDSAGKSCYRVESLKRLKNNS